MRLAALADQLGLPWHGDGNVLLSGAAPLDEPQPDKVSFCERVVALAKVGPERVGACIVPERPAVEGWNVLVSPHPRVSFARALTLLYPPAVPRAGIHPTAWVAPGASVHPEASIGPFCCVGDGCVIAAGCVLVGHVQLGSGTRLERNCRLEPHVRIGTSCSVGTGCHLEPHVQLAAGTQLGKSVYVGARCVLAGCAIEDGVKIDNLAYVGAETRVGPGTLLISQCLLRDRVTLGAYCVIAAQAVVDSDVSMADQVQVAGRTWVREAVLTPKVALAGEPAMDYSAEMKQRALRARCYQHWKSSVQRQRL
jgi:UDP-3-O-[3-hydroxymyristoyl] glucosamine N-acyltransferase